MCASIIIYCFLCVSLFLITLDYITAYQKSGRLCFKKQKATTYHSCFALQMNCVMVPMGQYTHQERGFHSNREIRPNTVDVIMIL